MAAARLARMPANRWLDRTQPQTLMTATMLMYINAGLSLITGGFLNPYGPELIVGQVAAGWGIANEKKWGYWLGVVLMALQVAEFAQYLAFASVLNLLFYGAVLALLLHPQSRSYRKVWFR